MGKATRQGGDDDGDSSGLSDESLDLLRKANAGKPCKFVLVAKSNKPVLLICAKKGAPDKLKKEAKTELVDSGGSAGGAQFICGAVGKNDEGVLAFQLPASEGWKEGDAPVPDAALVKFLKSNGLPPYDARIVVVQTAEPVLDPSDPLVARFLKLRDAAQALTKVNPTRSNDLDALTKTIAALLDQDPASDVAYGRIDELEKLIASIGLGEGDAPVPPAKPDGIPPPPPISDELVKFQARLTTLLKAATPLVAQIGGPLKDLAGAARESARQGDFRGADESLKKIGELIKSASQVPAGNDLKAFTARAAELRPAIDKFKASSQPEDKLRGSELGALIRQAAGFAQRGDFDEANRLLDAAQKLGQLAPSSTSNQTTNEAPAAPQTEAPPAATPNEAPNDQPNAPGEPAPNAPDLLVVWRDAKEAADEQLEKFVKAMRGTGHPYLQKIADFGLHGATEDPSRVFVKLQASLFDVNAARGPARREAASKAMQAVATYLAFVQSSKLIETCDSNKLCGPLTIRQTLVGALGQIEQGLQAILA